MNDTSLPPNLRYIHSWHYEMLTNKERNQFYSDLIKENCQGKVVFEIGTGSGLVAALCIRHGAEKVICCEENPMLAAAAKALFKRLGIENKIQLIAKNSKDIGTNEIPAVDVILHELFASDPFREEAVPTLTDAQRFLKRDGIFLPDTIQLLYQPIRGHELPMKIEFEGIELIEMEYLLSDVHPSLRKRDRALLASEVYSLPSVTMRELISKPYFYKEKNPKLCDVDAVEITYNIIHGNLKMQAAQFGTSGEREHWFPMVYYKMNIPSDELEFSVKDNVKLLIL